MVKIGIAGTGSTIGISAQHIKAFKRLKDTEITALYDVCPDRAEAFLDKFELPRAKVCRTYGELLDHVDAVIICTPNFTHKELIVKAVEAGKHVLCEKPLGRNAAEFEDIRSFVENSPVVCMLGFCYRNIPAVRYMKKVIGGGELGDIFYIRQSQGGNRIADPEVKLEWRMDRSLSGPGAVADFGSHMLDITDFLLRNVSGPIVEVSCMENIFLKKRRIIGKEEFGAVTNDDVALFSAKTEKGTLCSYTASRIGGHHTLEIFGSGGALFFSGDPFEVIHHRKALDGTYEKEKETVKIPEELYMEDENVPVVPFEINFYLQAREFVQAIRGERKVGADLEHGLYIQRLIDRLQESADEGRILSVGQ